MFLERLFTTMKKFNFLLVLLFTSSLFVSISSVAQTETINSVKMAIKAGDAHTLIQFFDNVIELKTDSEEGTYSKNQAEFVLKSFFRQHSPKGFTYNHEGSSPGGSKYTIGTYECSSGTFRVYMKIKNIKNKYVIDTLDFTKE